MRSGERFASSPHIPNDGIVAAAYAALTFPGVSSTPQTLFNVKGNEGTALSYYCSLIYVRSLDTGCWRRRSYWVLSVPSVPCFKGFGFAAFLHAVMHGMSILFHLCCTRSIVYFLSVEIISSGYKTDSIFVRAFILRTSIIRLTSMVSYAV